MAESSVDAASRSFEKVAVDLVELPREAIRQQVDEDSLERLRRSIAGRGVLIPLLLVRDGERFRLVAGLRRLICAKSLGLAEVPALVMENDEEAETWAMFVENYQREGVNAIDEAVWVARRMERLGIGQRELAKVLEVSESWLSQRLSVFSWPDDVRDAVKLEVISWSVGRELAGITDAEVRRYCLDTAGRCGCSVRQAALWRKNWQKDTAGALSERNREALRGGVREHPTGMQCLLCREVRTDGDGLVQFVCESCLSVLESSRGSSDAPTSSVPHGGRERNTA